LIEPDPPRAVTLATGVADFLTAQHGVICGLKFERTRIAVHRQFAEHLELAVDATAQ
jgi:hypothetical protein